MWDPQVRAHDQKWSNDRMITGSTPMTWETSEECSKPMLVDHIEAYHYAEIVDTDKPLCNRQPMESITDYQPPVSG